MGVLHTAYALSVPGLRRSCEQIARGTFARWERGMGGSTVVYLARDLGWELFDSGWPEPAPAAVVANARTLPGLSDRLSINWRFLEAIGREQADEPSDYEPLLRGSSPMGGLSDAIGEPVLAPLGSLQSYLGGMLRAEDVAAQRQLLERVDLDVAVDRIRRIEVGGVDFLRATGTRFASLSDLAAFAVEDALRLCDSLDSDELMWVILL